MNEQLLKTSGADVLSSRKKLRKTFLGVASTAPAPPPPLERPRVNKQAAYEQILMSLYFILLGPHCFNFKCPLY